MGVEFPLGIVERVMDFHGLVRAVGWDGARELSGQTFEGWEVDFLEVALGILSSEAAGRDRLDHLRLVGLMLGGR